MFTNLVCMPGVCILYSECSLPISVAQNRGELIHKKQPTFRRFERLPYNVSFG